MNININNFTKGYIQTLLFVESQFMKDNAYIANHPREWGDDNVQLNKDFIKLATEYGKKQLGAEYNEQKFWSSNTLEADVAFVRSLLDESTWDHVVKKCNGFVERYHRELADSVDAGRYFYFTHNRHGISFMDWERGGFNEEQLKRFFNSAVKFHEDAMLLEEHYDANY